MTDTLHFPMSEYDRRIQKTRAEMAARGFDLLVVTDPSNMAWLTGYDGWSFYVHQAVLFGLEGEPVWCGRGMDAQGAQAHRLHGARQHRRLSRHLRAVDRAPPDGASRRACIAERGWAQRSDRRRDGQLLVLGGRLRGAAASTAERALRRRDRARQLAAGGEERGRVGYMRRAARIVEAMHARIVEMVEPGMRKCDLVAEI